MFSSISPQKKQSLPTVLLWALTSDFTGGCPPPPSRSLCQRVNLQLQFIKFLVILSFNFQLSFIWSAEPTTLTNYAWAAKTHSRRCQGEALSAIREGACGLLKWCKLLVLKFDWSPA